MNFMTRGDITLTWVVWDVSSSDKSTACNNNGKKSKRPPKPGTLFQEAKSLSHPSSGRVMYGTLFPSVPWPERPCGLSFVHVGKHSISTVHTLVDMITVTQKVVVTLSSTSSSSMVSNWSIALFDYNRVEYVKHERRNFWMLGLELPFSVQTRFLHVQHSACHK